jgi:hypothetical protein
MNALGEANYGRRRVLGRQSHWCHSQALLVLKTLATFATICILWSLWTSESLQAWWSLWKAAGTLSVSDGRLVPAFAVGVFLFVGSVLVAARIDAARAAGWRPSFKLQAGQTLVSLAIVALLGTPEFYASWLPDRYAGQYVEIVKSTREIRLSGHDVDMVERGYYEQLLNVQNFNSQLWEVYASWPVDWSRLEDTGALRRTGDFLFQDLVPDKEIHFRNADLSTNRWGMRDRDYDKQRPAGVSRVALVGSSHVMGYGVNDDQTFDASLERYWNEHSRNPAAQRVEVLNFAVDGYCPLQELYLTELRVLDFSPQVLAHFAHNGADYRCAYYLSEAARLGVIIPYPELVSIIERAKIEEHMSGADAERLMRPYGDEILAWTYHRFVELCRNRAILPVWVYLPTAGEQPSPKTARIKQMAADAGFVTLDLSNAYRGHDPKTIWFGEWDHHPNALGHQLVADELYRLLTGSSEVIRALTN